jgi:outer membrane protein OmpA-like peptidoglycan-associated protein
MVKYSSKIIAVIFCISVSLTGNIPAFSQAENLVKNYSFEKYYECPSDYTPLDLSHKLLPDWTYPTAATPDYFNRCSPKNVGVPKNFAGVSEPATGDGYVGAILSGTDDSYREYIQGMLSEPMVKGKQYCVSYAYKLASYSKFAVDQISLFFSEIKIENDLKVNLPYKPQINNQEGLFLDNINDWETMCTVYTAKGGERFFIIGNFKSYENTNYVVTDKNMVNLRNKAYAYYYFDDVVIKPLDNCTDCPCVQHDFEANFIDTTYTGGVDPATGKIKEIINDGHIKLGMLGGTPPYSVNWSNGMTGAELNHLPAGKYIYTASDSYNCKSTGTVVFKEPEIPKQEEDEGLINIEEGASIVLKNIFFAFNKTDLLPQSFPELDKVADFILNNNIHLIEISGHTDNEGSEAYNQKLSEGRAKAVVAYLVQKGISPDRMRAVGYGESKPIDTNFTEEGRAVNRRVEFTLIKK